jgi:hypothetical protein
MPAPSPAAHVSELTVPLLVPPDFVAPLAPEPPPLPSVTVPNVDNEVILGAAVVDKSGRVRDQLLITTLGWKPTDRVRIDLLPNGVALRLDQDGPYGIDSRGQAILPAWARAHLRVQISDRVILAAVPGQGLLIAHSMSAMSQIYKSGMESSVVY